MNSACSKHELWIKKNTILFGKKYHSTITQRSKRFCVSSPHPDLHLRSTSSTRGISWGTVYAEVLQIKRGRLGPRTALDDARCRSTPSDLLTRKRTGKWSRCRPNCRRIRPTDAELGPPLVSAQIKSNTFPLQNAHCMLPLPPGCSSQRFLQSWWWNPPKPNLLKVENEFIYC